MEMDPQIKSILTSIAMTGAGSLSAWMVSKGYIPGTDQSTFATDLITLASGLVSAAIAWYKARQHTPTAEIAAVNNANNGVKVVADSVIAPPVTVPLKGAK